MSNDFDPNDPEFPKRLDDFYRKIAEIAKHSGLKPLRKKLFHGRMGRMGKRAKRHNR